MNKISFASRIVQIVLVIYAALHIYMWAFSIVEPHFAQTEKGSENYEVSVKVDIENLAPEYQQLANANMNPALWLNTPNTLFQLAIFLFLFLLFEQFRHGNIYSQTVISQIKHIGHILIFWPVFELIYGPLLIITLKVIGIIEHGEINVSLNNEGLEILAIGLMLTVASWIVAEGKKLKDEQDLTI